MELDTLNAETQKRRNAETQKRRSIYGLSPEWLLRDGMVVPDVILLSHDQQYEQLAELTPEALPAAVTGGDPCFDRMVASLPARAHYREALGADDLTTVVAVSSTWGSGSLMGRHPDLVSDLVAELPIDDHVVVGILHPNIWFAHGPAQIRSWLGKCLRAGMRLVPPVEGWQQAIIAADVVIGDHGAVSGYAAAIGRPVLLGAFDEADVVRGSAIEVLGRSARRVDVGKSLRGQVHEALEQFDPESFAAVAELASSVPGESARILRRTCYRLMRLAEPDHAALVPPLPKAGLRPERSPVTAMWVAGEMTSARAVRLQRWPAEVVAASGRGPTSHDAHLVVRSGHPRPDLLDNAAIVVHEATPEELSETLRRLPGCVLAVSIERDATCRIRSRDGHILDVRADLPPGGGIDATVGASVVYTWLVHGGSARTMPAVLTVTVGGRQIHLEIDQG